MADASFLAFGLYDPRAFFTNGFGFSGNGTLHLLENVEILDFDGIEHHTPLLNGLAKDFEQARVDRSAVLENKIELALADGIAGATFQ